MLIATTGQAEIDLVITAVAPEQELDALGRSTYERLFSFTGMVAGQPVSDYSWGEIQDTPPAGGVTPPTC